MSAYVDCEGEIAAAETVVKFYAPSVYVNVARAADCAALVGRECTQVDELSTRPALASSFHTS
jgi:hypothetical protein